VDSGEYRIYYEVDDKERTIVVLLVAKRGDDEVYRRLKRELGHRYRLLSPLGGSFR